MNKDTNKGASYTSAGSIPLKMVMDKELNESITNGNGIIPLHVQYMPTNKCNLNCEVCSCADRDKNEEISLEDTIKIVSDLKDLGTKAVTISGGGAPLMHKNIDGIINSFYDSGIKVGLVTNGLNLYKINSEVLDKLTWCRISNTDDRNFNDTYKSRLSDVVNNSPGVDWAFSHVAGTDFNRKEIGRIVQFANDHKFTHVRLVDDIYNPSEYNMSIIKNYLESINVDDSNVIYQNRQKFDKGSDCYIAYAKPVIGADKLLYMCCGTMYALGDDNKDFVKELSFGHVDDIKEIYKNQEILTKGNQCIKCFYKDYNTVLESMVSNIEHKEFI